MHDVLISEQALTACNRARTQIPPRSQAKIAHLESLGPQPNRVPPFGLAEDDADVEPLPALLDGEVVDELLDPPDIAPPKNVRDTDHRGD
jgi:hypothetical protein